MKCGVSTRSYVPRAKKYYQSYLFYSTQNGKSRGLGLLSLAMALKVSPKRDDQAFHYIIKAFHTKNISEEQKKSHFVFQIKNIITLFLLKKQKKAVDQAIDPIPHPCSKMLEIVHQSSIFCVLSYKVTKDHFLFYQLQGNPLVVQVFIFVIPQISHF